MHIYVQVSVLSAAVRPAGALFSALPGRGRKSGPTLVYVWVLSICMDVYNVGLFYRQRYNIRLYS